MEYIEVSTSANEEIIDITSKIRQLARKNGWQTGAVHIFCQHTTCGLTINEGADPDVKRDLMRFFQEIAPHSHGWLHMEGNTDAHIRASLLGSSLLVPIEDGELLLGRWQSIYLYEGDGPRRRRLAVQLI